MKRLLWIALGCLFLLSSSAYALNVSLVSGLYQSSKEKNNGQDGLGSTTTSIGARVIDSLSEDLAWFGEGSIVMNSYTAPSGGSAPDNSTGIKVGGGVRKYFRRISESFRPFVAGSATVQNEKQGSTTSSSVTVGTTTVTSVTVNETEKSGLYYGATAGMRMDLDSSFFIDFETPLFESALFATEKQITKSGGSESKTETSKMDLYINTKGAFSSLAVGFGMKF